VGAGDGSFGEGEASDRAPFFGREQGIGFAFQGVQRQFLGDCGARRDFAGRPVAFRFAAFEFEFGVDRAHSAAAGVFKRGVADFGFAVDRAFEAADRRGYGERIAFSRDRGFGRFFEQDRFPFVGRAFCGAFAVFVFAPALGGAGEPVQGVGGGREGLVGAVGGRRPV